MALHIDGYIGVTPLPSAVGPRRGVLISAVYLTITFLALGTIALEFPVMLDEYTIED